MVALSQSLPAFEVGAPPGNKEIEETILPDVFLTGEHWLKSRIEFTVKQRVWHNHFGEKARYGNCFSRVDSPCYSRGQEGDPTRAMDLNEGQLCEARQESTEEQKVIDGEDEMLQSGLSKLMVDTKTESQVSADINALPTELLLEITKHFSPCTSVCLGVTCRRFYAIHKTNYLIKVSLSEIGSPTTRGEPLMLIHLLRQWVGPKYRRSTRRGLKYKYLLRSVYGPGPFGDLEYKMHQRYIDYWNSVRDRKLRIQTHFVNEEGARNLILPNPFGKGDDWEGEAVSAIVRDLMRHSSVEEWRNRWNNFWVWRKNSAYFDKVQDEV